MSSDPPQLNEREHLTQLLGVIAGLLATDVGMTDAEICDAVKASTAAARARRPRRSP